MATRSDRSIKRIILLNSCPTNRNKDPKADTIRSHLGCSVAMTTVAVEVFVVVVVLVVVVVVDGDDVEDVCDVVDDVLFCAGFSKKN